MKPFIGVALFLILSLNTRTVACEAEFSLTSAVSLNALASAAGIDLAAPQTKDLTRKELDTWVAVGERSEMLERYTTTFVKELVMAYQSFVSRAVARLMNGTKQSSFSGDVEQNVWLKLHQTYTNNPAMLVFHYGLHQQTNFLSTLATIVNRVRVDFYRSNPAATTADLMEHIGTRYMFRLDAIGDNETPLPYDQYRLLQMGDLSFDDINNILRREGIKFEQLKEREHLMYQNIDLLTGKFHSGDHRPERQGHQLQVVPYQEQRFYDLIAMLSPRNRMILGLYLIERHSTARIKDILAYTNILSVNKQLNRAMQDFKEVAGLQDDAGVRANTIVVMLREQKKLQRQRRKYYHEADLTMIALAKQYTNFDPSTALDLKSYANLLSLINPVQAEIIDQKFRRQHSTYEITRTTMLNKEQIATLIDLGLAEMVRLTKNKALKTHFLPNAEKLEIVPITIP